MKNILEYKGYYTNIEIDFESHELHGKIEGIGDLVNFMSDSVRGIEQEFHSAVDDYIDFCQAVGKTPETSEKEAAFA